ncbi:MAG TPA: hypothetical protein VGC38_02445 [Pseudolabrys sp.]
MTSHPEKLAVRSAVSCLFAGAMIVMAVAQEPAPKPAESPGFFGTIASWFGSTFQQAGKGVATFSHEAGIAAKTTVDTAKDAAGAVAKIPGVRMVTGHEKCRNAPNGAPDCQAAADAVCKAKGFETGKSMDMTTAQVCPASVLLSGRGECKDETFVSRALCQ